MGGGLENFDLVEYAQTKATYKIIAKGWMDLYNPTAGYDSASAARADRVELEAGKYYDYTLYLQPNLYTVQAGHRLALVIFTDTRSASETYTITIDNTATYADIPVVGDATTEEPVVVNPFTDVAETDYYYTAVLWASQNGIVNGTTATTFTPGATASRAQMVAMLWRAAGKPEASVTAVPFVDVDKDAYYYPALLWAYENKIVNGVDATHFRPDGDVTREQIVSILYRQAGSPAVTGTMPFVDVTTDRYSYNAILWAAENGITKGVDATHFGITETANRAQLVTLLQRSLDK
jgi:hypothetical protein